MEPQQDLHNYKAQYRQNNPNQYGPFAEWQLVYSCQRKTPHEDPNTDADAANKVGTHDRKYPEKGEIVFTADAVVEVFAVMIHVLHTSLARPAVVAFPQHHLLANFTLS